MTQSTTLRATMAILMIVLGNLQAWDSGVHDAGLLIVLLVSIAIALPAVALLLPVSQQYLVGTLVVSLILIFLARVVSPIPLPELFIALAPAALGLIFASVLKGDGENRTRRRP